MAKIISIHSFRGGTGKSNLTANLAASLAAQGRRVAVVDTDILSPGIHLLFGFDEAQMKYSLNDYLWGKCDIKQTAVDVTGNLAASLPGRIFLIPSSLKAGEIARILREGYDAELLNEGFQKLVRDLALDVVLIDTHPGLNKETLLSIAISDALVIILRPDQQDYQGTSVTVEVARKLDVPRLLLVVNKAPAAFDPVELQTKVERRYACPVAAVIPHADEMMLLASGGIFTLHYPNHPVSALVRQVNDRLMA